MIVGIIIFIFKGKDLGYLKFHLSMVIYAFSLFIPLFYGSMGIINDWPNAKIFYSYAWLSLPLGVIGFYIIVKIWDYILKN